MVQEMNKKVHVIKRVMSDGTLLDWPGECSEAMTNNEAKEALERVQELWPDNNYKIVRVNTGGLTVVR